MNMQTITSYKHHMKTAINWTRYITMALAAFIFVGLFFSPTIRTLSYKLNLTLNPVLSNVDTSDDLLRYELDGAHVKFTFKKNLLECKLITQDLAYYKDGVRYAIPKQPASNNTLHSRPDGFHQSDEWFIPNVYNICDIDIFLKHDCGLLGEKDIRLTHFWDPPKTNYCKGKTK